MSRNMSTAGSPPPVSPPPVSPPGSRGGVLVGAAEIASAPGTVQIHDLPYLLDAAAGHARAQAQVIAAAWRRCRDAEGTDGSVSAPLQRALSAQLAIAQALERAAEHARALAAAAPDFRPGIPTPMAPVGHTIRGHMVPSSTRTGLPVAAAVTAVAAGGGPLQVHDLPPMLDAAYRHVAGQTDVLVAAFARMQQAENADATISGHLAAASSMQHHVAEEFARGRDAAARIASVTPDFRKGYRPGENARYNNWTDDAVARNATRDLRGTR